MLQPEETQGFNCVICKHAEVNPVIKNTYVHFKSTSRTYPESNMNFKQLLVSYLKCNTSKAIYTFRKCSVITSGNTLR